MTLIWRPTFFRPPADLQQRRCAVWSTPPTRHENSPHSSSTSTESGRGEAGMVGSGPSFEVADVKTVLPGAGGGESMPNEPKL